MIKPIIKVVLPADSIEQLGIAGVNRITFRTREPIEGLGDYVVSDVSLGQVMEEYALFDPVGCVCDLSVLDQSYTADFHAYNWSASNPMNTATDAEIFKAAYQVALRDINNQITNMLSR